MTEKFHQQLDSLKKELIYMSKFACDMLKDAMQALINQDANLAEQVNLRKHELADLDHRIEEKALVLLTLHQPMAIDLRTTGCILKMVTYLYRIGRYGKDIANVTKKLSTEPHLSKLVNLPRMSEMVIGMIEDTLKAFETGDISLIRDLGERDNSIDAQRYSILRLCISYMMEDHRTISRYLHYAMIARYLERCADHACKMGEKVHYMVTGEHIEIS